MRFQNFSVFLLMMLILNSCATYQTQYKDEKQQEPFPSDKKIVHSVYLLGDAGNSDLGEQTSGIRMFGEALRNADSASTAIFLGDNIYEKGLRDEDHPERQLSEHRLQVQIDVAQEFSGKSIFIPGNHDWYSGLSGLKRQEKFIEDQLGKDSFLPEDGCPIETVEISKKIQLIIVDSRWYLNNWDNYPGINSDCEIKTRNKFFDEFESEIKKARGKTTIVAIHHPIFTNGSHGGQYSFKSHLSPIPVLGTLKNLIRKTGGVVTVDDQNILYRELKKRIVTISQHNDKVIFVSGHDHNLQYIVRDNLPQIVSGSGSKEMSVRLARGGEFGTSNQGYARLDIFEDGSSFVRFYDTSSSSPVFRANVLNVDQSRTITTYPSSFPSEITTSIYTAEEVAKSGFYKTLWGERYRKYFGTPVKVKTVNLDTLYGGLSPMRRGGGHQSNSLRLVDKAGREYVMRALKKNALRYLQSVAFRDQYIEGQFDDSVVERFLLDIFTGSHPYAPFVIPELSKAAGIYHTTPLLVYVPKQNALGPFNSDYGNELYMIEERAADGHGDKAGFGYSNELISTDDLLEKLSKNEDHILDESSYIRARLFDMVIGDWDRHEDQWRWATFKEDGKTVYRPVPRDRDQAFSVMSDGLILGLAGSVSPLVKLLDSYESELKSPKWFNLEPYPLDIRLIRQSDKKEWDRQVAELRSGLTDNVIEKAFKGMPEEVRDVTVEVIKKKLKGRLGNLQDISDRYFEFLSRYEVVVGTNKDDWFEVERLDDGLTRVKAYRIIKGEKGEVFHQRTYTSDLTREIWIYGLDDKDRFDVFGNGSGHIRVRLIGGKNHDEFNIENGHRVLSYDYRSKNNTYQGEGQLRQSDDYKTNVYDHRKLKYDSFQLLPSVGANPDDGLKIGLQSRWQHYGFEQNPFTSSHIIGAAYYFATGGFEFQYSSELANVFGNANLEIMARFNSPNYAVNFFGFGNESDNPEAVENDNLDVGLDYNRVKIRTLKFAPSLVWRGRSGSEVRVGASYESNEVERTNGRFLADQLEEEDPLFDKQDFIGTKFSYRYSNVDNSAFPTLGMLFNLDAGFLTNTSNSNSFAYLIPELGFDYRLSSKGDVVLASKIKGHINIGDDFELYQAATLGADSGLRGFRNQRFSGNTAFVQTSDLRWNIRKARIGLLPFNMGVYGGFDYGRVWLDGEDSDIWHNSVGGGVFLNAANVTSLNASLFNSNDGLRFAFRLGFEF